MTSGRTELVSATSASFTVIVHWDGEISKFIVQMVGITALVGTILGKVLQAGTCMCIKNVHASSSHASKHHNPTVPVVGQILKGYEFGKMEGAIQS